jgi:oligosaccharide repeat unit polymerase
MALMSDFPISQKRYASPNWRVFAPTRAGDVDARPRHLLVRNVLAPHRNLPLYCNPIVEFFVVWILMLACLTVRVSYVIYPEFSTPLLIVTVSAISLLLGYFASTAVFRKRDLQSGITTYALDVTNLRRFNVVCTACAFLLIAYNWATSGPPPAIGDSSTYLTYGQFKQVLFPLITAVAVNSTLDPSKLQRCLFIAISLGVLALYVARGIMLVAFLQMFFLLSLRSRSSKKMQYLLAVGFLSCAIVGMTIVGNLRTAHDIFVSFLQIRDQYSDWPMAWLWLVSYISIPFSNLCWMIAHASSHGPTLAFLYPLLPTFVAPQDPYNAVYGSTNIIDNASTYLQTYALDFSYLGIYFVNLALGTECGWIVRRAYPKHMLIVSIFLTSMSLIFFTDMFFLLSTVIQVLIQTAVERKCFRWEGEISTACA